MTTKKIEKSVFLKFCFRFYGLATIVGLFISYLFSYWQYYRIPSTTEEWKRGLILTLLLICISFCLSMIFLRMRVGLRMFAEFTRTLPDMTWFERVLVAASSGIGEETIFRGAFLPMLGLHGSSIIFGLIHIPVKKSLVIWTFFALAIGYLLGWLTLATESLIFPILGHALINYIGFEILKHIRNRKRKLQA